MEEKEVDLKQKSAPDPSFKKGQDSWTHETLRPLQRQKYDVLPDPVAAV